MNIILLFNILSFTEIIDMHSLYKNDAIYEGCNGEHF